MLGNKGGGCQLTGLLLLECCPAFAPGLVMLLRAPFAVIRSLAVFVSSSRHADFGVGAGSNLSSFVFLGCFKVSIFVRFRLSRTASWRQHCEESGVACIGSVKSHRTRSVKLYQLKRAHSGLRVTFKLAFQAKHLEETQETFGLLLNLLHKLNIDELNDYRDYVVNLLGWGSKRISGGTHLFGRFHVLLTA